MKTKQLIKKKNEQREKGEERYKRRLAKIQHVKEEMGKINKKRHEKENMEEGLKEKINKLRMGRRACIEKI